MLKSNFIIISMSLQDYAESEMQPAAKIARSLNCLLTSLITLSAKHRAVSSKSVGCWSVMKHICFRTG